VFKKDFITPKRGRATDNSGKHDYHGLSKFPKFYNTLTGFVTNSKIVNQLFWDWDELPRFTLQGGDISTLNEFIGDVNSLWREEWDDLSTEEKYDKLDELVDHESYQYNLNWGRDGKDYTLSQEEEGSQTKDF
jgi:hypothetical protein